MTHFDTEVAELLKPWAGPFGGLPSFDSAKPAAIEQAYRIAATEKVEEVRAIAALPLNPTFDNTLVALEDAGRTLDRIEALFRILTSTCSNSELREVEQRISVLQAQIDDEISTMPGLFARLSMVAARGLPGESGRLAEVTIARFLKRGAALTPDARLRLAKINSRLAELQTKFSQNLLVEQDHRAVVLDCAADLAGLDATAHAVAAQAAADRGLAGHFAIANTRAAVIPFLIYSTRRDLREKVWRMWTERGASPGPLDNRPMMQEILHLRGEKARLLGFPSFAHYNLADRMAKTPEAALALLETVWCAVLPKVNAHIAELQALAREEGQDDPIQPWDRRYWSDRYLAKRHKLDTGELAEHLELQRMLQALFWTGRSLFGLDFIAVEDAQVAHPDVQPFAVSRSGKPVGVLFFDLFQREGKKSGAWMQSHRRAENFREPVPPLVSIVMNVNRPPHGKEAKLDWELATILFHEFGHALHYLNCNARYPSLGPAAVAWDFIEVPSQLHERWLSTLPVITQFALHGRTGRPLPLEIVEAVELSRRTDLIAIAEYTATAIADLKIHLAANGDIVDPISIEDEVLTSIGMPSCIGPLHRLTHLSHAFSGDQYAAGYYAYQWADTMVADIAEAFAASPGGFYDREQADCYFREILSVGATVPADVAFRAFRGRDPDTTHLMQLIGTAKETPS